MSIITPNIQLIISNLIEENNLEKSQNLPETLDIEDYKPIIEHFKPSSLWYIDRVKRIDFITGRLDICYSLTSLGLGLNCTDLKFITIALKYALQLNSQNLIGVNIEELIAISFELDFWLKLVNYFENLKEFGLILKLISDNIEQISNEKQLGLILKKTRNKLNYSELIINTKEYLLRNLSFIEFSSIVTLLGDIEDLDIQFLQIQIQILAIFNTFVPGKSLEYWLKTAKDPGLQKEVFDDIIYNELEWDDLINVLESPFLSEIPNDNKFKLILSSFEAPSPQLDIWLETNEMGEDEVKDLTFDFVDNSLKLSNPRELASILVKCENWLNYLSLEVPEVVRKLEFVQGLSLLNDYYLRLNILAPPIVELISNEEDKFQFIANLFKNQQTSIKLYLEDFNLLKLSYLLGIDTKGLDFSVRFNTLLVSNAISHRDFAFSYRLILSKFKSIQAKSYGLQQGTKADWVAVCLNLIRLTPSYSAGERRLVLGWATSLAQGDSLRVCLELGKLINELPCSSVSFDHPMYWTPLPTTSNAHQELINEAYFPPSGLNLRIMKIAGGESVDNLNCDSGTKNLLRDLERGLENAPKWLKLANSGKLRTMHFPTVEMLEEGSMDRLEDQVQVEDEEGDGWGDEIGDLQVNEDDDGEGEGEGGWGDEVGDLDLSPAEEKHTSPLQAEEEPDAGGWDDEIGDLEIDPVETDKPDTKSDLSPTSKVHAGAEEDDNNGWNDELNLNLSSEEYAAPEASAAHNNEEEGWNSELGNATLDSQAKSSETSRLAESYPTPQHDEGSDSELLEDLLPNFAKLPIDTLISIGQIPLN